MLFGMSQQVHQAALTGNHTPLSLDLSYQFRPRQRRLLDQQLLYVAQNVQSALDSIIAMGFGSVSVTTYINRAASACSPCWAAFGLSAASIGSPRVRLGRRLTRALSAGARASPCVEAEAGPPLPPPPQPRIGRRRHRRPVVVAQAAADDQQSKGRSHVATPRTTGRKCRSPRQTIRRPAACLWQLGCWPWPRPSRRGRRLQGARHRLATLGLSQTIAVRTTRPELLQGLVRRPSVSRAYQSYAVRSQDSPVNASDAAPPSTALELGGSHRTSSAAATAVVDAATAAGRQTAPASPKLSSGGARYNALPSFEQLVADSEPHAARQS